MKSTIAAGFLLVVTAACGHEPSAPLTKVQYERQAGEILSAYGRIPESITFPDGLWRRSAAAADALGKLHAPPAIRGVHAHLVNGFQGIAEEDRALADAFDDNADEFQAALDRVATSPGGVETQRALAELKRRGYRLPSMFGVKNVGPMPGPPIRP